MIHSPVRKCPSAYFDMPLDKPQTNLPRLAFTLIEVLIVIAIIAVLLALLLPAQRTAREAARRNQCQNNLKQIAIALNDYAREHGALPPAYTTDANGKPLHSWRVLVLPYMEEQELFDSIDLTKPWDDPVNAKALSSAPACYLCPSSREENNHTSYLAVVTPHSAIQATEPRPLSDIKDASRALMLIEADREHAVPWMSPRDANEQFVMDFGGPNSTTNHPNGVNAAFVDSHVEFQYDSLPADYRRAFMSNAETDNDTVGEPERPAANR